ncbi:MAG TPA: ATP-binding protein [Alphaproteobacteria bacterium]|nr:ATP-binding protein [Alphaproteobacteria bacterium]
MPRDSTSWRRVILATALLEVPVALVLAALVEWAHLGPGPAILALIACGALIAILVGPHIDGIARLTAYLEALAEGREEAQPRLAWSPLATSLASAVGRIRRRSQQRREEASARLAAIEAVIDSLPDPLVMLDSRLRIARVNAAAAELMPEEASGRELSSALRVPALLEGAQSALRRGTGARVEFELASPVKRAFVGRIERLGDSASDEAALIVVLHDVTAEKRAEQMRADFVANASHELRTPLATLLGFIETLLGPASEDERARARFLGIMQKQAGRMSRLVDDLLSLSRIELREHTAPTDQVDALKVLYGVVDALQPQSKSQGIAVAVESEAGLPLVAGDADELAQVFQNLIDNALKYGRRGSTVRVGVRRSERCPVPIGRTPPAGLVAIEVADEGEGIPKEQIPRLTERFYRVDAARSRELGGTGLGLAIVKHIVSHHRGALHIESIIGRGSSFTVYLPAAGAARRLEEEPARSRAEG